MPASRCRLLAALFAATTVLNSWYHAQRAARAGAHREPGRAHVTHSQLNSWSRSISRPCCSTVTGAGTAATRSAVRIGKVPARAAFVAGDGANRRKRLETARPTGGPEPLHPERDQRADSSSA